METMEVVEVRPRMKTHPECERCCARGKCHFCAGLMDGVYSVSFRGHTYFICSAHKEDATKFIRNHPQYGRPGANVFPVSPLLR